MKGEVPPPSPPRSVPTQASDQYVSDSDREKPPYLVGACARFYPKCCSYHEGWDDAVRAVEAEFERLRIQAAAREAAQHSDIGQDDDDDYIWRLEDAVTLLWSEMNPSSLRRLSINAPRLAGFCHSVFADNIAGNLRDRPNRWLAD